MEFGEFSTHAVILSEARSAKSKNLRIYLLHGTNQVRRSFDSLALAQDDNRCTNPNLPHCLFRVQQGQQSLGVVAIQSGTLLGLQIQTDGIHLSLTQTGNPAKEGIAIVIVARI